MEVTSVNVNDVNWEFVSKLVVRKTGFPFEILEQLHWKQTSSAITKMFQLDGEKKQVTEQLLHNLIPKSVVQLAEHDHKKGLHLLSRLRKYLGKGAVRDREINELRELFTGEHPLLVALNRWKNIEDQREKEREKAYAFFQLELKEKRKYLQMIFKDPYIAEAVYVSNPDVFNISYPKFIAYRDFDKRPSKIRTLEMRFYSYLQRFCSKNDTASFFGPMNYAKWDKEQLANVKLESTVGKYSDRIVHYSFWMVKELAKRIAEEADFRPYLTPKLHPMCKYDHDKVSFIHIKKELHLPETFRKILQAIVTDSHTLYELSHQLNLKMPTLNHYLKQLEQKKMIILDIEIPSTIFDPFTYLYSWVQNLPPIDLKNEWLNILEQFVKYKEEVLTKDLAYRQKVTAQMETLFEQVTHLPARRNQGQMYADRTLYYEECKGTINEMSFGKHFHEDFMKRIKPIFDISAAYGDVLRNYYQTIARRLFKKIQGQRSQIPYCEFIYQSQALLEAEDIDLSFSPLEHFHQQLEQLVHIRQDNGVAKLSESDVRLFDRFRNYAECHTSPDIMFSAKSIEALAKGDYKIVLGEVHQFIAMWGSQLLFDPEREKVNEEINQMLEKLPMYRQLSVILNTRRHKGLIHESFPGTIIQLFGAPSERANHVVEIRDLYVTEEGDELSLVDTNGNQHYLYNSGDENIHLWAFAPSRVSSPAIQFTGHTPRIEINDVIFQRERWDIGAEELLTICNQEDPFLIYVEMQRLKQKFQLPRYLFFKVKSEKKPYYFDFENFFSVEMLHSLLKKNKEVSFIEMEPSPENLWLKDDNGKYCFEMRGTVFQKQETLQANI